MNNIKTKEDVLTWAKIIVDGKGEKYIPLGKADMFAIAKYVAHGYGNLTEDLEVKDDMPPPTDPEDEPQAEESSPAEEPKGETDGKEKTAPTKEATAAEAPAAKEEPPKGTALALLGARGMHTAQEAFDAFLKDTAKDEKKRRVIDFSTGSMNVGPAFMWWVLGQIEGARANGL